MTSGSSHDTFRNAADAEGGMPISAGARVAHVRMAVAAGRSLHVDLSRVPEDLRPEIVARIQQLVDSASVLPAPNKSPAPPAPSS